MAESGWLRHALAMGWFDYRRTLRGLRDDAGRLVLMSLGVVLPTLVMGGLAVLFASELRGLEVDVAVSPAVRGGGALFWLFGCFLLAQRTATAYSEVVAEPFVLTTVSTRTAVVGGVVAEALRALSYVLAPGLLAVAVAIYAFGSPLPLLAVPLAGCLFVGSAVTVGRLLGYVAAWLVARVPFVARHRTLLSGAVSLLFFGGYFLFQMPGLPVRLSPALLAVVPTGWLADLFVVGTPIGSSTNHAAGGVVAALAAVAVAGWGAERVAASLWFGDEVDTSGDDETAAASTPRTGGEGALARGIRPLRVPLLSGPTLTVARWALLRARREPQRLNFLLIPLFAFVGSQASTAAQSGGSLELLGPASAVLLGWTAGAAFGLNPFGDEGPVLPVTLTAATGRQFVHGLVAPALLFAPVAALLAFALSLVGGYAPLAALALGALAAFVTAVGAMLAPLVGMWFPRYSAIRIGNSDEVRPPRLLAGFLHLAAVGLPGAALAGLVAAPELVQLAVSGIGTVPGVLLNLAVDGGALGEFAAWLGDAGEAIRAFPLDSFRLGLAAVLVVGGLLAVRTASRLAVRHFDAYEPY